MRDSHRKTECEQYIGLCDRCKIQDRSKKVLLRFDGRKTEVMCPICGAHFYGSPLQKLRNQSSI